MNRLKALLFLFSLPLIMNAQETAVFTDPNEAFKAGEEYYEKGLFGQAQAAFKVVMEDPQLDKSTRIEAELFYAKAAVRLDRPTGEKLINNFIRREEPSAVADKAKLEMGDYYYDDKNYQKAIEYYSLVDFYGLPAEDYTKLKFKLGYSYFVRKKNRKAKVAFKEIANTKGTYYAPANYYYGMTQFYDNEYDEALVSFQRANAKKQYQKIVPYYILQIQAANKNYGEVIRYGEEIISKNKSSRYKIEIKQLVGQAYFEQKQYDKAMPYLEEAAKRGKAMRKEDFYQVAYCQYRNGKYKEAINNFQQLNNVGGALGQNAMYHLGDCQLKINNKQFARNAFYNASKITNGDNWIREEALFNYAKLCYELKYDREAVDALQSIPSTSSYYPEGQRLLSDLFLNTNDYERALSILNALPNKSTQLNKTLHKVTYLRGVQLYKDGKLNEAFSYFNKASKMSDDNDSRTLSYYWLGDIAHKRKNYTSSKSYLNLFLKRAKTSPNLPEEASYEMGLYSQGYNYIKEGNFQNASILFSDAADGIFAKRAYIQSNYIKKQVLVDAILRSADANFKVKNYRKAKAYYDKVITGKFQGEDYAMYRKGIIRGIEGNNEEKIILLNALVDKFPKSEKADDALYAMGKAMMNINRNAQARGPLNKLITKYPKSEFYNGTLFLLGLISINTGDVSKAINYYKKVFEHSPSGEEQQIALASLKALYVEIGKPDDYFAFIETLPGYNVDNIAKDSLNYNVAFKYLQREQFDKAITAFTNYISKYSLHKLDAYYFRGTSYLKKENYSKALKDFEYVISKGPSSYYTKSLKFGATIAYENQKDYSKALKYYADYEKLVSGDEQLKAQVRSTESAYRIKNKNAVQSNGNKVVANPSASNQQKATAHFYMAKMAYDENQMPLAQNNFSKVYRLISNEMGAEAYYYDAKIHYKNRDLAKVHDYMQGMGNYGLSSYWDWVARMLLLGADAYMEQGELLMAKFAVETCIEKYNGDEQDIKTEAQTKLATIKSLENSASKITPTDDGSGNRQMDAPIGNE